MYISTGGGGVTSFINVYTDVRLEWGILFRPPSIWMGIFFTSRVYQWGIFFAKKVYEYVKFKKKVYELGIFSLKKSIWMIHVFHLAWYMNGLGSGGSQPHIRTQNHGKLPPPPPQCTVVHGMHLLTKQCILVGKFTLLIGKMIGRK